MLEETLNSILAQDPGAGLMQIQVVDDASTDQDIAAMVQRIGNGRIEYFRQENNQGSLKNFETCLNLARGEIVHLLHADDLVRPGYYRKMDELFKRYEHIGAAFSHYDYIDEKGQVKFHHPPELGKEGILENWLQKIARKQYLQYCAISVKREVYEKLGGFYGVNYGEDWEMWARIATLYPCAYTPESLTCYRMHSNTISSNSFLTGKNVDDIRWVIETIQQHLPEKDRAEVKAFSYRHYAHYSLTIANSLWHQTHNRKITNLQISKALGMHKDRKMIIPILKIYLKMLLNRK